MHESSSAAGDILFVGSRFRVVCREQRCGDGEEPQCERHLESERVLSKIS